MLFCNNAFPCSELFIQNWLNLPDKEWEFYLLNGCAFSFAEECGAALGMESGAIKDEDINASSSHSIVSVGPQTARWVEYHRLDKSILTH